MTCETVIKIGGVPIDIFMQDGFFKYESASNVLHAHRDAELHAVIDGSAQFIVGDNRQTLTSGEMLIVKPNVFHRCLSIDSTASHIVFQFRTSLPLKDGVVKLSPDILSQMLLAIDRYKSSFNITRLRAYLTLVCESMLLHLPAASASPITDREFIIYEFFAKNYASPATVADLAELLGVCEKQAERLVRRYTGSGFREQMTQKRIEAARLLVAQGMSLSKAAERVGYRTYSGFWRAYAGENREKTNKIEKK